MPNSLPENFSERWGRMEEKVDHMEEKLKDVHPADIKNLKQDMALIKRVGGTIVGGIVVGLGWAWRKLINGGI